MQVIGAGFWRTGTMSLKEALEELGFGPYYHAIELFENPAHAELWEAAERRELIDWDELLGDYEATVDWMHLLQGANGGVPGCEGAAQRPGPREMVRKCREYHLQHT